MSKKLQHIAIPVELHRLVKIQAAKESETMAAVIRKALQVYNKQMEESIAPN